jgi:hypothetical protein
VKLPKNTGHSERNEVESKNLPEYDGNGLGELSLPSLLLPFSKRFFGRKLPQNDYEFGIGRKSELHRLTWKIVR